MNRKLGPRAARGVSALGALLSLFLATCSSDSGTNPGGGSGAAVSVVRISPASSELGLGSTLQLDLTALDDAENEVTPRSTVWSSQDTSVATVSAAGLVTARRIGAVQLQAVADGRSATSLVSVVAARVARVAITPAAPTVAAGRMVQLAARTTDAGGVELRDRLVFWESSNNAVALVTSTGLVSGQSAGTATIKATSEGQSATTTVTVTGVITPPPTGGGSNNPPPVDSVKVDPADTTMTRNATARFRVRVYAGGATVTNRTVTWSSSDTDVLTVNGSGDVTTLNRPNQQTSVNASVEGKVGSATVRIANRAVSSVVVSADPASLRVGESGVVSANLLDSDGGAVGGGTAATWVSSNPAVLEVSSTGNTGARVTARAPGSARVTALAAGVEGSVTIAVTAPPQPTPTTTRVDVTPATRSLVAGASETLAARAYDASGAERQGRTFTWQSSAPNVATVTAAGVVTAISPGTATISATADGVSGNAAITVTAPPPAPVASVAVTPTPATIAVGATQQLEATPRDAAGTALTGRGPTTWTSSAASVATVSPSGLVTAVGPGTATITATIEGVAGSAAVTVPAPPATTASVVVTPATASIPLGGTRQLTAVARDAGGAERPGRTFTWTSSAPGVATVSATGLVTAVAAGTATITAADGTVTGTATISVAQPAPAPVASVAVTPTPATVAVGATQQLTATARDAGGATLAGRGPASWTSSAPGVATVSATGLVTAVAPGTATITATIEGVAGTASVTVPAPPVTASVTVTPPTASLAPGATQQLTATARDASGAERTGREVTWTSSAPAVATVSGTGLVTAVGAGSATITATADGVSGTAAVTVSAPAAASVSRVVVSPKTVTMRENATLRFTATTYDAADNVITGRSCRWAYVAPTSPPRIMIDSATGEVRARRTGAATITATCDGRSDSAFITIVD